jgi:hypothetical protein
MAAATRALDSAIAAGLISISAKGSTWAAVMIAPPQVGVATQRRLVHLSLSLRE